MTDQTCFYTEIRDQRGLCAQQVKRLIFVTRILIVSALACLITVAQARDVPVYDAGSLHRALRLAQPGDDIILYPGYYKGLKSESPNNRWHYYYSHRSGTENLPITVRSYSQNDLQTLSGDSIDSAGYVFYLTGDHWRIRDLEFHTAQKGIMLDSANYNVLDNIAVHNVRDEGVHFRQSSSNNVLRNCLVYNTGRLKPGFGEAVYVGTHEGDRLEDHSNNNRIGGCQFGPGVTAEAVDIKAGTVNTIIESNTMDGRDITGVNYADSFIDVKGDDVYIRLNDMHWYGNSLMDHGIHILKRQHTNSNIYENTVTMGSGMPFLKIGRGTVHTTDNRLNYDSVLASLYSSGAVDTQLDDYLPEVHSYTGFKQGNADPEPNPDPDPDPDSCLSIDRDEKVEIDHDEHSCIEFPENISGRLLQVWDSNENNECNFRGKIIAASSDPQWQIDANYAGTHSLSGNRIEIVPSNGCPYLIVRWL